MRSTALANLLGDRYRECSLDSFEIYDPSQKDCIDRLTSYLTDPDQWFSDHGGALFVGPCGSGKDHLMASACRHACKHHGVVPLWVNGLDLFAARRDRMSSAASERDFISKYTKPSVLAISDPLPPRGNLTEFQINLLFQIVDRRYRDHRPTWFTLNVANRDEGEARMSVQVYDRIRHASQVFLCDWPSYRSREIFKNEN